MGVEAEGITYGDGDIPGYNTRYLNKNEDSIATFSRASIYLNDKSNDDPHDGLVSTVEHKLGHAIDLKHYNGDDRGASVMYPDIIMWGQDYVTKPTPYDITKVKQLYKEK